MTEDLQVYVAEQVERLGGSDGENAFHNLIDLPQEVIPLLQLAYPQQSNPVIRAGIVEVVWQFRDPKTLPFLADALDEADEEVWQQALDGIVTIGGDEAVALLVDAQMSTTSGTKRSYIVEAIEQRKLKP